MRTAYRVPRLQVDRCRCRRVWFLRAACIAVVILDELPYVLCCTGAAGAGICSLSIVTAVFVRNDWLSALSALSSNIKQTEVTCMCNMSQKPVSQGNKATQLMIGYAPR